MQQKTPRKGGNCMKKKLMMTLALVLIIPLAIGLAACGDGGGDSLKLDTEYVLTAVTYENGEPATADEYMVGTIGRLKFKFSNGNVYQSSRTNTESAWGEWTQPATYVVSGNTLTYSSKTDANFIIDYAINGKKLIRTATTENPIVLIIFERA
jgi:hypothetical protein